MIHGVDFDLRWPGAVPDIIRYLTTEFYNRKMRNLDSKYHVALDEAYESLHNGLHITQMSQGMNQIGEFVVFPFLSDAQNVERRLERGDKKTDSG